LKLSQLTALEARLRPHGIVPQAHLQRRPFTDCLLGVHADSDSAVFIKLVHSAHPGFRRNFLREVGVLERFAGEPGFPLLRAASCDPALLFHACAYLRLPTLAGLLGGSQSTPLPTIAQHARALASWIAGFHGRAHAHRDLSPDHVFIDAAGAPAVVDFGLAKPLRDLPSREAELCRGYDIQALGMIAWELICGRPLFPYRGEALAARIAIELEVIAGVSLPVEWKRLLWGCLGARSEFTPEGSGPHPFSSIDDVERALSD